MKIFLDTKGTHIVVQRMKPIWKEMGHSLSFKPDKCDVQLSFVNIRKKTDLPLVLRLDGVYYDKGGGYKRRNSPIGKSHKRATSVIYQSHLSKDMCEKYLATRKTPFYEIIYNGIEPNWCGELKHHTTPIIVSCAKWRRPKRLKETIEVFEHLLTMMDARLYIVGPMSKGCSKIVHERVKYFGHVKHDRMQDLYRKADAYIHLCKKDSCPSTVVEAIGSGIPVVTTNACGGATEMCNLTDGCEVIEGEPHSLEPDFIYNNEYNQLPKDVRKRLAKKLRNILKEKRRVILPNELTVEYMARRYIKVMKKAIKNK